MTTYISCTSLIYKSDYKFKDGGQNGSRARVWLYLKRLYFISSVIAYCISPYASFYAGLSCVIFCGNSRLSFKYSVLNFYCDYCLNKFVKLLALGNSILIQSWHELWVMDETTGEQHRGRGGCDFEDMSKLMVPSLGQGDQSDDELYHSRYDEDDEVSLFAHPLHIDLSWLLLIITSVTSFDFLPKILAFLTPAWHLGFCIFYYVESWPFYDDNPFLQIFTCKL